MKNKIIFSVTTILLLSGSLAFAGVPDEVERAFSATFKNAKVVKWTHHKGFYEAKFKDSKGNIGYAVFNAKAKLVEKDVPVSVGSLPENVKSVLQNEHRGSSVKAAYLSEKGGAESKYIIRLENKKHEEFEIEVK